MTRSMTINRFRQTIALTITATVIGLAACSSPTTIEEHFDVEGVALYEGTVEVYRYMLDDGTPSGLTLEQRPYDVTIILLDHDGEPISDADHDEADHDEHELRVTIEDMSVLTWTPEAETGDEAHDFVEFHGELNALQPGSTTMTLCVPHGDHCDFEAIVPVTVTAP
jgi:hypothetical protein